MFENISNFHTPWEHEKVVKEKEEGKFHEITKVNVSPFAHAEELWEVFIFLTQFIFFWYYSHSNFTILPFSYSGANLKTQNIRSISFQFSQCLWHTRGRRQAATRGKDGIFSTF